MKKEELINKYENIIKNTSLILNENQKKFNICSLIRGIIFLLMILFVVLYFISNKIIFIIISSVLAIAFIIMIFIHKKIDKTLKYCKNKIEVCNNYLARINGNYHGSSENEGMDFYDNNILLKDLNIIGKDSLYQYLCVARTNKGRNLLYKSLTNSQLAEDELLKRQEAIGELGEKIDFCVDFEANSKEVRNNTFFSNVEKYELKHAKSYLILSITIFVLELILIVLCGCDVLNKVFALVGPFLLVILFLIFIFHNRQEIMNIEDCNLTFDNIKEVLKKTNENVFTSEILVSINQSLLQGKNAIVKFLRIYDWDSIRKTLIVNILVNAIFPISILILYLTEKHLKNNSQIINEGISAYELLECLLSLSVLNRTKEQITKPKRIKEVRITAQGLKHPLLSKCVENDFDTDARINIITGSNMSGKTSFMRTLAVNLILMNAGAYVEAKEFKACYLHMFTSMQTNDNITKGISSFYSEMLRIKKPIEFMEENKNMIVFIDEIFHGTNSNDRIFGAKKLLEKLAREDVIVLITTHDFELCDIENVKKANYHFSEYYEENRILFDYKIKKGKCTTTNAIALLKLSGIIK